MIRAALPIAAFLASALPTAALQVGPIERVSSTVSGGQTNGPSGKPHSSADGRFVVFESSASNLWGKQTSTYDIFVHDRLTGALSLISHSPLGRPGTADSRNPKLSANARWVAFNSQANNLVAGDTNGAGDVFLLDRTTDVVSRISATHKGKQSNSDSFAPALSADGSTIAFPSDASNLVNGDSNGSLDIFVRDFVTDKMSRVSVSSSGQEGDAAVGIQGLAISRSGRHVAFTSAATNLVGSDTNGVSDVFVRDRVTRKTKRISLTSGGLQANFASFSEGLDGAGALAVLTSQAQLAVGDKNLHVDVFSRDDTTGHVELVSRTPGGIAGNSNSGRARIAADGRFIVYQSHASDIAPGDTNGFLDIFLHDRLTGVTAIASRPSASAQSNNPSFDAELATSGAAIVFASDASNLAGTDSNGTSDVFVVDLSAPTVAYCPAKKNSLGCKPAMRSFGIPRASALEGFSVHAILIRNNAPGLLLYGTNGRVLAPFQCGMLCVRPPLFRTPVVNSSGSPVPFVDCSGSFSIDMATFASGALGGSPQPGLAVAGTTVNCQWWGPDPGYAPPCDATLSNALEYSVLP